MQGKQNLPEYNLPSKVSVTIMHLFGDIFDDLKAFTRQMAKFQPEQINARVMSGLHEENAKLLKDLKNAKESYYKFPTLISSLDKNLRSYAKQLSSHLDSHTVDDEDCALLATPLTSEEFTKHPQVSALARYAYIRTRDGLFYCRPYQDNDFRISGNSFYHESAATGKFVFYKITPKVKEGLFDYACNVNLTDDMIQPLERILSAEELQKITEKVEHKHHVFANIEQSIVAQRIKLQQSLAQFDSAKLPLDLPGEFAKAGTKLTGIIAED